MGEAAAPEQEALLADSVGLALLVVLETLGPAERLAYVLHDMFGMSFDEIAPLVGRNSAAARQLASRARRRIQRTPTSSDADLGAQREVADAFLGAARGGDLEGLLAVLAPDVELRVDEGTKPLRVVRGARAVAGGAVAYQRLERIARPAVVNGAAGLVSFEGGQAVSVLGFTIVDRRIVRMDILADPARLARLELAPPLAAS